jgi:Fe-S cluster biogenesis protein NfuA
MVDMGDDAEIADPGNGNVGHARGASRLGMMGLRDNPRQRTPGDRSDPPAFSRLPPNASLALPKLPPFLNRPMSTDATATLPQDSTDPRALTVENVERVLDELRPYLMADGGNVEIVELDGPVVKVRLQGACGSCPSSTMTLKMGIERKLREAIPEVTEVVQVL